MSSIDYPLPKEINSKSFEVKQTARWFHLGQQPSNCGKILIALHGYGQHPAYMMESLKPLLDSIENLCIVAPEGLSRFYIKGTDGRVGASWMTRDDRVQDIKDNIYPEETHKATATLFERLSLNFESLSFDGSHKMTAQNLKDLI